MRLTLIATGGTIASTPTADGSVTTTLSGADLLERLPALPIEVDVVEMAVAGSWNLTTDHVVAVAEAVRAAIGAGAAGVVVTHGTDVIEETAWLLELLVRPHCPGAAVVCTASMRHAGEFGSDGARNLADALAVAADPAAAGAGVLVCANGELHHARHVTKTHATALCTFASPGHGPAGEVGPAGVRIRDGLPGPPPASGRPTGAVPVLSSHWDVDDELVHWHLDRGAAGLVVEGGGAGNINRGLVPGVRRALDSGLPVVVATRCRAGEATPVYGGDGGFAALHALGARSSRGLGAGKARLAVQAALGSVEDPSLAADHFDRLAAPRWTTGR